MPTKSFVILATRADGQLGKEALEAAARSHSPNGGGQIIPYVSRTSYYDFAHETIGLDLAMSPKRMILPE